jgi:hypothetical protein
MFGIKIKAKRRSRRKGPVRFNWSGLLLNSVTVDLWFWNGTIWERERR